MTITKKSAAYEGARKVLGGHRKVYESVTAAIAGVRAILAVEGFPTDFPVVGAGIGAIDFTADDSVPPLAEWPAEYHTDGTKVAVSFLGVRGLKDESGKDTDGARALVVMPLHPIDAIMADDSGAAWLWKIAEKEASHVAFRGLRNVAPELGIDALAQAAQAMPLAVSDYVDESSNEETDTSAFDALWKTFRKLLSQNPGTAPLVKELPNKPEVIKSIRSKAYAIENYDTLENIGAFVWLASTLATMIDQLAEESDDVQIDSAQIRAWVGGRDTKVFQMARRTVGDLSAVNFGAFMVGPSA